MNYYVSYISIAGIVTTTDQRDFGLPLHVGAGGGGPSLNRVIRSSLQLYVSYVSIAGIVTTTDQRDYGLPLHVGDGGGGPSLTAGNCMIERDF